MLPRPTAHWPTQPARVRQLPGLLYTLTWLGVKLLKWSVRVWSSITVSDNEHCPSPTSVHRLQCECLGLQHGNVSHFTFQSAQNVGLRLAYTAKSQVFYRQYSRFVRNTCGSIVLEHFKQTNSYLSNFPPSSSYRQNCKVKNSRADWLRVRVTDRSINQ